MSRRGPYELLELLGEGTSGQVYRAQVPGQGEAVALKTLRQPPDPGWLERLRALSSAPHPNVCPLLDAGQDDQGWYLVFPWMAGGDLDQARTRFEDGRVPLRTVLRWGIAMLSGLEALHQAGYLHGDIKPSNIFLQSEQGPLILGDFSTLAPLGAAPDPAHGAGTPEYLPENPALWGQVQRDLHAVALTLASLLLGRLATVSEAASLSQSDPLIPPAVDQILGRALGSGAAYASASAMQEALQTLLGGAPPSPSASLSPPTRKVLWSSPARRAPLWPWLVAGLMLVAGFQLRLWLAPPAPTASSQPTALWTGMGVAPAAFEQRVVWQVRALGRPLMAFAGSDPAAGGETARQRAEWCAAVLEEAHFLERPLRFEYRREFAEHCDVYLVGEPGPEQFLFRVTPAESQLFDCPAPRLARIWCALLVDTVELLRPSARSGEKGPSTPLTQPWRRRYETLLGSAGPAATEPAVPRWVEALDSLDSKARDALVEAYFQLAREGR